MKISEDINKKLENMTNKNKEYLRLPGYPLPLGATLDIKGAQFSIFSSNATSVTLVLFDPENPNEELTEIEFDDNLNRTGDIWHIWIEGVKEGQLYGYRIDGLYQPDKGHRFNKYKLLIDPYARAVTGNFNWQLSDARGFDIKSQNRDLDVSKEDSAPGAPKCVVVNHDFDWYDRPLKTTFQDSIVYEMHVRGFTMHESSKTSTPGTYKALTEKIPYLKELGVTAVELMPIQEFDENENLNLNPITGENLKNYWGYNTISFFAPKSSYAAAGNMGEQFYEFKEMVRDFHNAGIEVILDVVFNHTAEGDQTGPTLCFRGIDNAVYYILENDKHYYKNFSGCGNTLNCNHPFVRDFILDCLKYWVIEMHIDGFRFDLASILGRDQFGNILSNPPLIERIEADPILKNTKIIAEAWDAAGAYQVGDFPGRWADWNGVYRDQVRSFWRGDDNMSGNFATRLTGSADLYAKNSGNPHQSINFITCHDGFPLNDVVSFNHKHNYANGEDNRDGHNHNITYNYGIEGLDSTPFIEKIRKKQIKNFLATLFLSQGVPMLLAGDEFRNTQMGNNNAYCQDNEISWLNWDFKDYNIEVFNFTKKIISFRKAHPILRRKSFFTGRVHKTNKMPDIAWHGIEPYKADWTDKSRLVACTLNGIFAKEDGHEADNDIYMAFNSSLHNYNITLPESPSGKPWKRIIDTSLPFQHDIVDESDGVILEENKYHLKKQSTLVLISEM